MSISAENFSPLPKDLQIPLAKDGEPVFAEPWEAKAFAIVVSAHRQGQFDWRDFQQFLVDEIGSSERAGHPRSYYVNWAIATERLFESLGKVSRQMIDNRVRELRPNDKTVRL